MTDRRLEGKVALITGSDSGIGQATAIAFAKEGADVVVTYLDDLEGAEDTAREVGAAGQEAIVVQVDVSDEDHVGVLFDAAVTRFGQIDILVNNAGVDASGKEIPWKRAASPDEIARLAVFLASSDADYVTGSTYTMDGGLSRNLGQGA